MTERELAVVLVEKLADANIDKKISAYLNRLMLRFHSQQAILANLTDVAVFKPNISGKTDDQVEDGRFNEDLDAANPNPEQDQGGQESEEDSSASSTVKIQLSFRRLPQEIIAPLLRLIAAPREAKLFRFTKDGQARTGVEIELKPEDFPGEEYDYSF